jgi:hypothetical protein
MRIFKIFMYFCTVLGTGITNTSQIIIQVMKNLSLAAMIMAFALISCNQGMKSGKVTEAENNPQRADVLEVLNGSSYTYLRVKRISQEEWIAISLSDIKAGDVIYYEGGLEMNNFESKELQRTFERIYFVSYISDKPLVDEEGIPGEDPHAPVMGSEPQKPVLSRQSVQVDRPAGSVSIAELYSKRDNFSGKTVMVKGQVTKVNTGIMGRNWVHIQDGTADGDNFDLTITTDDEPTVGEIVTYSGVLNLNRDFGAGYTYALILEDAMPLR